MGQSIRGVDRKTLTFTVDESCLSPSSLDTRPDNKPFLSEKIAATEKETIEEALRESQGRIVGPSGAPAKLGIARSTLESKIRAFKIDKIPSRLHCEPASPLMKAYISRFTSSLPLPLGTFCSHVSPDRSNFRYKEGNVPV